MSLVKPHDQDQGFIMSTYAPRPLTLVKGEGARVWDDAGKSYLDFTTGIAVNILGHCPNVIHDTLTAQSLQLLHCSNLFHNQPAIDLSKALIGKIGPGQVFFCNSGAEANEVLFKLARKFGHEEGRFEIITANNSFHGRTFAGISATGQEKVKKGFEPLVPGFKHVPFNDLDAIKAAKTDQTVAVHIEGIQGEGGIIPADPKFLIELRRWTKENKILLLWDGVQCGQFRTGHFQSYTSILNEYPEGKDFLPDAIAMAKSLGGGIPIGAAWVAKPYQDVLGPGTHGCTYGGNPLSCAVALAVMEEIDKKGYGPQMIKHAKKMKDRLSGLVEQGRIVAVRGEGAMIGIELKGQLLETRDKFMKKGLLVVPSANQTLRLLPPINVTGQEVEEALGIIEGNL